MQNKFKQNLLVMTIKQAKVNFFYEFFSIVTEDITKLRTNLH